MIERGGARVQNPTIAFYDSEGAPLANRLWYHIPRIGDHVDLGEDGQGIVEDVTWSDERIVVKLEGGR